LTSFSGKENATCVEEKLALIKQLGKGEGNQYVIMLNKWKKVAKSST
jgi:hypothetical protein